MPHFDNAVLLRDNFKGCSETVVDDLKQLMMIKFVESDDHHKTTIKLRQPYSVCPDMVVIDVIFEQYGTCWEKKVVITAGDGMQWFN